MMCLYIKRNRASTVQDGGTVRPSCVVPLQPEAGMICAGDSIIHSFAYVRIGGGVEAWTGSVRFIGRWWAEYSTRALYV